MIEAYRRRIMGFPYDSKIEYIQSEGNAYITVPCNVTIGDEIALGGNIIPIYNDSTKNGILGSIPNDVQFRSMFYSNVDGVITYSSTIGNNSRDAGISLNANIKQSFELSTLGITTNGVFRNLPRSITSNITNFIIFKRNIDNQGYPIKLCDLYIKVNNVLIFDAISVRIDTVGYLYDRITDKLFGNEDTGNFILGNDIV